MIELGYYKQVKEKEETKLSDLLNKKGETKMAMDKIKNLDERTIDCDTIILGIENCLNTTCWKCPYLNVSICRYAILEDARSAIEQMVKNTNNS